VPPGVSDGGAAGAAADGAASSDLDDGARR
jgi:hypothetical protein